MALFSCIYYFSFFLDGFFKSPSFKIAMSWGAGVGWASILSWALSEIYLLVKLFEEPVHNAVRCFSCLIISLLSPTF